MNQLEDKIKISRKVIIDMLKDRGYQTEHLLTVLPEPIFIQLWSTFTNDSNVFDLECENKVGKRIYVKYIKQHIIFTKKNKPKTLKLSEINNTLRHINDLLFDDNIIYVICDTEHTDVIETYDTFLKQNNNIEIFDIKRLLMNITKHSYVPQHIKIPLSMVNKLKQDLQISSIYKLPVIAHTDPVARYFNFKRGDVIKIVRISPSYGTHISYRVCSDIE